MQIMNLCLFIIQIISNILLANFSCSLVLAPLIKGKTAVIFPEHQSHPIHVSVFNASSVFIDGKVANIVETRLPEGFFKRIFDCVSERDRAFRVETPSHEYCAGSVCMVVSIIQIHVVPPDVIQFFNRIFCCLALALYFKIELCFLLIVTLLIENNLALSLVYLVEGELNLNFFIGYSALLHKILKCSFEPVKPVPIPMQNSLLDK